MQLPIKSTRYGRSGINLHIFLGQFLVYTAKHCADSKKKVPYSVMWIRIQLFAGIRYLTNLDPINDADPDRIHKKTVWFGLVDRYGR